MRKLIVGLAISCASFQSYGFWSLGLNGSMTDVNGVASHGYGIHGGFHISPYLGFELGYKKLGEDHSSGVEVSYDSLSFLVQPNYRLSLFNVYANLGTHLYEGESELQAQFVYGIGAELPISNQFTLSTEYNFYNVGATDIEALTFKANYYF